MEKRKAYIQISEKRSSSIWTYFTIIIMPIVFLALSIYYGQFFRNIFMFFSVVLTVISCIAAVLALKDKERGIKRKLKRKPRPIPNWIEIPFFIGIIAITAGLKFGYYIIPSCWLITWIALANFDHLIKATYEEEPNEDKS